MKTAIRYSIIPKDLGAHLFSVTVAVDEPDPQGQVFHLPTWIPGSYMIREFARNIVQVHAESNGQKIDLTKLDKSSWQAAPCQNTLFVQYDVYAWDLSVRAAHLDQTHGFFNGTSVFLRVAGQENKPHIVDIRKPDHPICQDWQVATALPEYEATRYGFGTYISANYDELIDHPVEMGNFKLTSFDACGVKHDIAITGQVPNLDIERLVSDLQKICQTQIAFFEPDTKTAPISRYVFLIMAVGKGYGGLEHRASTVLLCSRSDLPAKSNSDDKNKARSAVTEGYQNFLGLCSHEYFHTWHVKRIKPAAFAPYDLQNESYTRLLWLFEGFTSYYDDLVLVRCGLMDASAYLHQISRTINKVMTGSGRKKQTLTDASFDAWIKFYRPDENSPNALISYYQKGSLLALSLDLTIRDRTQNKKSLDDIMLLLWQRYGRDFEHTGQGIRDIEVETLFEEASELNLKDFFQRYIYGTEELPFVSLLAPFGIDINHPQNDKASLNVRVTRTNNDCKIANVYEGGAAHKAGLSAGDFLIAIDGLRIPADNPSANLEKLLERYPVGATVEIHAFRRDELMTFQAVLSRDMTPQFALSIAQDQTALTKTARQMWLKLDNA